MDKNSLFTHSSRTFLQLLQGIFLLGLIACAATPVQPPAPEIADEEALEQQNPQAEPQDEELKIESLEEVSQLDEDASQNSDLDELSKIDNSDYLEYFANLYDFANFDYGINQEQEQAQTFSIAKIGESLYTGTLDVAVMLPKNHPQALVSKNISALLDGIYQKNNLENSPTRIDLYDTHINSIPAINAALEQNDYAFSLGPLLPKTIQTYLASSTLAQNLILGRLPREFSELSGTDALPGLYSFGLFNEDEVESLLTHLANQGYSNIGVIYTETKSSFKHLELLEKHAADYGIRLIDPAAINIKFRPGGQVAKYLDVDKEKLEYHKQLYRKLARMRAQMLKNKQAWPPEEPEFYTEILQEYNLNQRRDDLEGVILLGNKQEVQMMRSLLSFYLAHDLPSFSFSNILEKQEKQETKDLTNIFIPMPPVHYYSSPLKATQDTDRLPMDLHKGLLRMQSYDYSPTQKLFFALGYDALLLQYATRIIDDNLVDLVENQHSLIFLGQGLSGDIYWKGKAQLARVLPLVHIESDGSLNKKMPALREDLSFEQEIEVFKEYLKEAF